MEKEAPWDLKMAGCRAEARMPRLPMVRSQSVFDKAGDGLDVCEVYQCGASMCLMCLVGDNAIGVTHAGSGGASTHLDSGFGGQGRFINS